MKKTRSPASGDLCPPESFAARVVRNPDAKALDAEQAAAPFKVAAREWQRLLEHDRRKRDERFNRVLREVLAQIPQSVVEIAAKRSGGQLNLRIRDDSLVFGNGQLALGQAIFEEDPVGSGITTPVIELTLPLLFAPKEVIEQIFAHELGHVYLGAIARRFDGSSIPDNHPMEEECGKDHRKIEIEIEIDRLTTDWGFVDRNEYYLAWELAVATTDSFDCLKEYRAFLKLQGKERSSGPSPRGS